MRVEVLSTGVANTAAVLAGLRRAGAEPVVTADPERVHGAERLVLPGVGAFGAAVRNLKEAGVWEALGERIRTGRATLCVCLGLQLLCETSEESPGIAGLGAVPGEVCRFSAAPGLRVPQMGWNRVRPSAGARYLSEGYAYFANSYRLKNLPEGFEGATSEHGGEFVAALERGGLLACQFHPELSGDWGTELLRTWLVEGPRC